MQGSDPFEQFAVSGLETLGIEPSEAELAVIRVADGLYRPRIDELMSADFSEVPPEADIDLGAAPRE